MKTRLQELDARAWRAGLYIRTYSPGDGVTRYRFFEVEDDHSLSEEYFSGNGIYTALGLKEANTFIDGVLAAKRSK